MSAQRLPLVSVVTPVYNGEPYLRECIESVCSQTYANWEYVIVNNCSEDRTLEIVDEYRRRDGRIRVCSNDRVLPIMANHNRAVGLISADSEYCKVVSADDCLYPECLARMVELATSTPSIGIVGSYQICGGGERWYVRNCGLPHRRSVVPGRDVCRSQLLGTLNVFGNPTSTLYRADLVRRTAEFYPNPTPEADTSACLANLHSADFGFVHQILSHERLHERQASAAALDHNAYLPAAISDCMTYGDLYLTRRERDTRVEELLNAYYRFLANSALKFKDDEFWNYHAGRLREFGMPLDKARLLKGVSLKFADLLLSPGEAVRMAVARLRRRRASAEHASAAAAADALFDRIGGR